MASKTVNKGKTKKPLRTTLGKAAVPVDNPQLVDLSSVQKPIDTSIFGLRQVLSLFGTATEEVRRYITYECDIIYECRICRSMYRSLANFILHKRNYCRDTFSPMHNNSNNTNGGLEVVQENDEKSAEAPVNVEMGKIPKKNLNTVLKRLCNKQTSYDKDVSNISCDKNESRNKIVLEKISTNSAGVFQTFRRDSACSDLMKSEVMEIHNIFASTEAVLGPDGKTISTQNTKKIIDGANSRNQKIVCTVCNLKFSTKKTLTHHMKYKHNEIRVIYSCPECKDTFANAWCVFRHLYKVHHKSTSHIRNIRDQVHADAIEIKRDSLPPKSPVKSANVNSFDQENQWINDIESDNDLQMCGGCGKRFERKAALNSHSHLCTKRLAVYNTLKKNKRVDVEDNSKRKANATSGAQKRKPKILKKTKQCTDTSSEISALKQEDDEKSADCVTSDGLNENITSADLEIKSENKPIIPNKTKLKKSAVETITFDSAPSDTITDLQDTCSDIVLAKEEIKEEQLFTDRNIENYDVAKINEQQALKTVTSNNCNSSNHSDDTKKGSTENFDNDENIECRLEESSPNHLVHANNSDLLYIALKKPNILKEFGTCSIKNMKCDILPSNNNNNNNETYVRDIGKCSIEKVEEKTEGERSQNDPDVECKKSSDLLDSMKKEESLDMVTEENNEFTEIKGECCEEQSDSHYEANEELNFPKSDETTEILFGVSTEFDAERSSEGNELFSLYDDNSSSLTTNLEFSERQINTDANPNLANDAASYGGENASGTDDAKSKKRKGSSDEENELDDLSLEIKSEKYIDPKKLSCLSCNLTFISKFFLIKHMSLHFNWFCFQCSKCSFMSYDRQTCIKHIDVHKIQSNILDNIVLPIPHWKTVNLSTSFNDLSEQIRFESEGVAKTTEKKSEQQKSKTTLTETNKNDPMLRKMIMEVIFGSEQRSEGNGEKSEPTENVRPVRNRTRIQKIQKDFVYDMKQIDMKAKEKKSAEAKVKPIKIVKGVDTHFKVVRGAQSIIYKKRRKITE